jgi:hypothetical protein
MRLMGTHPGCVTSSSTLLVRRAVSSLAALALLSQILRIWLDLY